MPELQIGQEFAGHRIEGLAGRGGMGVVYRATHLALDRLVALKLISGELGESEDFRERFKRESKTAASIQHPNVIPIYHAGEEEGLLYITMMYVEGTDLRELIASQGALEPRVAVELISQTASALDAAHNRGLIHRDVKPGNVLIGEEDGSRRAFLTDFGLTKQASSQSGLTKTGMFVGTLDYIAPEQLRGQGMDARVDVYALGCVLYQALTGRVPYPRDSEPAKIWAHMGEPPPSVVEQAPGLPPQFDEVVRRALAKSPEERYPSAGDLGRAALAAVGEAPITVAERSVAAGEAAAGLVPPPPTPPSGTPIPPGTAPGVPGPAPGTAPAGTAPGAAPVGAPPGTPPGGPLYGPGPPAPAPPAPPRRRSRTPLLAGLAVLALLVVGGAAALLLGGGGDSGGGDGPPAPGKVVGSRAEIGAEPDAATAGAGGAYAVLSDVEKEIAKVSPSGEVTKPSVPGGSVLTDVAVGEGGVWVADASGESLGGGDLVKLDPGSGSVAGGPFPTRASSFLIAVGEGGVFSADFEGMVSRNDAGSGDPTAGPVDLGGHIDDLAAGEGGVWVLDGERARVTRLDPASLERVGEPVKVGETARAVAVGEGKVWVANAGDDTVSRIDATTGQEDGPPIKVGSFPVALVVAEGSVWVANNFDATVTQLDASTGQPVGSPITVADDPDGIGFGEGRVFVVSGTEGEVTQIQP
jgi:streptogramin lyase